MPVAGSGARRKALIIGCSYPGTAAALKGCINDAQCMAYALKKVGGSGGSSVDVRGFAHGSQHLVIRCH